MHKRKFLSWDPTPKFSVPYGKYSGARFDIFSIPIQLLAQLIIDVLIISGRFHEQFYCKRVAN